MLIKPNDVGDACGAGSRVSSKKSYFTGGGFFLVLLIEDIVMVSLFDILLFDGINDVAG